MGCGAGKAQPPNQLQPQPQETSTAETRDGSGVPTQQQQPEDQKPISEGANDNTARRDSGKALAEPKPPAAQPAEQPATSADPIADPNPPNAELAVQQKASQQQPGLDSSAVPPAPTDPSPPAPESMPEQDLNNYDALTPHEMQKISTWVGDWIDAEHVWMPLPDLWGTTNPAYQQRIQRDAERRAREKDRQKQSERAEASVASIPPLTGAAVSSSVISNAVPQTPVTPAPELHRPQSPSQNEGDPSPNVSRIGGFGDRGAGVNASQFAQPSSSLPNIGQIVDDSGHA